MTAETRADAQINVRRMSLRAYDTAVNSARAEPATNGKAGGGTGDTDAWAELEESGLAQSGQLAQEWAQALAAAPDAPVQIRVVARSGEVTFDTDIVLLPGLGLATTQRSITHPASNDSAHEPAVELVAFPPERIWPAVCRVLPPVDAMRADPRPTPPSQQRTLPDSEDLRAKVLAGGDAHVSLLVAIHTPQHGTTPFGLHRWVTADQQLYEVRGSDPNIVAVHPGAIAHELIYLVTGAYTAAATHLESQATQ